MNRDQALKAVDNAFDAGVAHSYEIFVEGLELGTPIETLAGRFRKALAFYCDAHGKTTAVIQDYFNGFKS